MLLIAAAGTAAYWIGEFNTTIELLLVIFALTWIGAGLFHGRR